MELPSLPSTDAECEVYAKYIQDMEDTIHDLIRKNQDIEKAFACKSHVLKNKAHELENMNA